MILSTNGTIYRPDIFEIFKEDRRYATVVISLDGTKEIHDANRPFLSRNGGSSYVIIDNIRKIVAAEIPHSVTCVVPQPFDFVGMSDRLHALDIERLEIKTLNYHIHGKELLPEVFDREFEQWRSRYIEYSAYHLDYMDNGGRTADVDRYYKFQDFVCLLGGGPFHKTLACGVADDKIGVASDGRLFPCEAFLGHKQFEFGHVRSGFETEKYRQPSNADLGAWPTPRRSSAVQDLFRQESLWRRLLRRGLRRNRNVQKRGPGVLQVYSRNGKDRSSLLIPMQARNPSDLRMTGAD